MSRQSGKPKKSKGVGAGIVGFGVTFALYSILFHPHSLGGLILALILSGLVGTIIRIMGSGLDLTTHNKQDAEPESLRQAAQETGNPEVDALLQKGRETLAQLREERNALGDKNLAAKLTEMDNQCAEIFRTVYDKPAKASQIRKFMDYYLPTTLKMVKAYRTLGERGVAGADAADARRRIDDALGVVLKGCRKLLDNLYRDDVLDITTDIDVLEQMLKRDGLTESDLQKAAEQARQAAALNRQVDQAKATPTVQIAPAAQTAPAVQATPTAQPAQLTPAAQAAPSQQPYDPTQWHTGKTTDVAQQVQSAVAQAQAHAPQAPVLDLGAQATAQATFKQES